MSLFNWFSKAPQGKYCDAAVSSGLGHIDPTIPLSTSPRGRVRMPASAPGSAANRKGERLERREQLYGVVRESLTGAGILSSSYKFKVLSLDSRGRQYLIMMDIARHYLGETTRLAEIEGLIAQSAKARYDILVTAVYWRVNEHVTAGLTRMSAPAPLSHGPSTATPQSHHEPLLPDEVAAFKQALASVTSAKPAPTPSPELAAVHVVRPGRNSPASYPVFADTELEERPSPLSGTQYGDLN